jgi:hypothetical protein
VWTSPTKPPASCHGHQFESPQLLQEVRANRRGFRVGRNPRNSGRLVRGVAVCEPNSGLSPRSEPEIARQSQPAKFRFPDHEMAFPVRVAYVI